MAMESSIGAYIFGETLGTGTFGRVILGSHVFTGLPVAIKIFEKRKIAQSPDLERVSREIFIMKAARNENITQLLEVLETASHLFLVMEYAPGGELFNKIVQERGLSESKAVRLLRQIVSALVYLHSKSIAHRDLKPGDIKIADFGLGGIYPNRERLSLCCGSPCYACPEMVRGTMYRPELADVWSLGVNLFAMVCGRVPFEDPVQSRMYMKVVTAKYKFPDHVSIAYRDLVSGMLCVCEEKRYRLSQICIHPWINPTGSLDMFQLKPKIDKIHDDILLYMEKLGFPQRVVKWALMNKKHDLSTATYFLLKELRKQKRGVLPDDLPRVSAVKPRITENGWAVWPDPKILYGEPSWIQDLMKNKMLKYSFFTPEGPTVLPNIIVKHLNNYPYVQESCPSAQTFAGTPYNEEKALMNIKSRRVIRSRENFKNIDYKKLIKTEENSLNSIVSESKNITTIKKKDKSKHLNYKQEKQNNSELKEGSEFREYDRRLPVDKYNTVQKKKISDNLERIPSFKISSTKITKSNSIEKCLRTENKNSSLHILNNELNETNTVKTKSKFIDINHDIIKNNRSSLSNSKEQNNMNVKYLKNNIPSYIKNQKSTDDSNVTADRMNLSRHENFNEKMKYFYPNQKKNSPDKNVFCSTRSTIKDLTLGETKFKQTIDTVRTSLSHKISVSNHKEYNSGQKIVIKKPDNINHETNLKLYRDCKGLPSPIKYERNIFNLRGYPCEVSPNNNLRKTLINSSYKENSSKVHSQRTFSMNKTTPENSHNKTSYFKKKTPDNLIDKISPSKFNISRGLDSNNFEYLNDINHNNCNISNTQPDNILESLNSIIRLKSNRNSKISPYNRDNSKRDISELCSKIDESVKRRNYKEKVLKIVSSNKTMNKKNITEESVSLPGYRSISINYERPNKSDIQSGSSSLYKRSKISSPMNMNNYEKYCCLKNKSARDQNSSGTNRPINQNCKVCYNLCNDLKLYPQLGREPVCNSKLCSPIRKIETKSYGMLQSVPLTVPRATIGNTFNLSNVNKQYIYSRNSCNVFNSFNNQYLDDRASLMYNLRMAGSSTASISDIFENDIFYNLNRTSTTELAQNQYSSDDVESDEISSDDNLQLNHVDKIESITNVQSRFKFNSKKDRITNDKSSIKTMDIDKIKKYTIDLSMNSIIYPKYDYTNIVRKNNKAVRYIDHKSGKYIRNESILRNNFISRCVIILIKSLYKGEQVGKNRFLLTRNCFNMLIRNILLKSKKLDFLFRIKLVKYRGFLQQNSLDYGIKDNYGINNTDLSKEHYLNKYLLMPKYILVHLQSKKKLAFKTNHTLSCYNTENQLRNVNTLNLQSESFKRKEYSLNQVDLNKTSLFIKTPENITSMIQDSDINKNKFYGFNLLKTVKFDNSLLDLKNHSSVGNNGMKNLNFNNDLSEYAYLNTDELVKHEAKDLFYNSTELDDVYFNFNPEDNHSYPWLDNVWIQKSRSLQDALDLIKLNSNEDADQNSIKWASSISTDELLKIQGSIDSYPYPESVYTGECQCGNCVARKKILYQVEKLEKSKS